MHRNETTPRPIGQMPNILLSGVPCMGKSAAAKMLMAQQMREKMRAIIDGARDGVS